MAADNASFAVSGDSHVALKAAKASLFNRTTSASSIARLAFSRIACTTKSLKVFEPTKAEARAARFLMSGSNRRSSLATLCCIFSSAGNFSVKEFSSASPVIVLDNVSLFLPCLWKTHINCTEIYRTDQEAIYRLNDRPRPGPMSQKQGKIAMLGILPRY